MNFTESFQEFSSKLSTTDLALYAGAGLVLWVLFKDKLSPVQKLLGGLVDSVKNLLGSNKNVVPVLVPAPVNVKSSVETDDLFFKLVVSWKQTRDLAVSSGCDEAVKVADQMFPYLSPTVCVNKEKVS
jgi:hypothetical protein